MEAVLEGISSEAICEAAKRYAGGLVEGQNTRFAPSVAEFAQEVRRIASILPYRGRKALPKPKDERGPNSPEDQIRMGFKMSMLSAGLGRDGGATLVREANDKGLGELIELARTWGIPVPAELASLE